MVAHRLTSHLGTPAPVLYNSPQYQTTICRPLQCWSVLRDDDGLEKGMPLAFDAFTHMTPRILASRATSNFKTIVGCPLELYPYLRARIPFPGPTLAFSQVHTCSRLPQLAELTRTFNAANTVLLACVDRHTDSTDPSGRGLSARDNTYTRLSFPSAESGRFR